MNTNARGSVVLPDQFVHYDHHHRLFSFRYFLALFRLFFRKPGTFTPITFKQWNEICKIEWWPNQIYEDIVVWYLNILKMHAFAAHNSITLLPFHRLASPHQPTLPYRTTTTAASLFIHFTMTHGRSKTFHPCIPSSRHEIAVLLFCCFIVISKTIVVRFLYCFIVSLIL